MEYILIRWFEKHETAHVYISNWHLHVISLGIAYVTLKLHNKHRTRIDVTSCVNDAQRIMSLMLKIVAIVKLAIMTISFIKCGWKCSKKLHSVGDLRKRHDRQHAQNMTDTSNFVNTFSVIALWMIGTWERFNFFLSSSQDYFSSVFCCCLSLLHLSLCLDAWGWSWFKRC